MSPEMEEIIQRSLNTIEENLRSEISVEELSRAAGFSLFHYCRIFEAATGMSVGRYITRRRLLHAAYAMSRGMRAIDAALEYGFDTHAGFYKAFRKEFGCAPSVYLRTHRAAMPARVNLKERTKMIDKKQAARALEAWNLHGASIENVYYPNTGHRSETTFCVQEAYFLKASQRPGELARQAKLQRLLYENGLGAKIIAAKDQSDVVNCGDTELMLMERLEGACVNALDVMAQPRKARIIGEGLARLHGVLRTCDPLLCREENLAEKLENWALPRVKEATIDAVWMRAFIARFAQKAALLETQIIHRDPNPDNIFVNETRVTGFTDFELSRIQPRIFDICYTATGILSVTFAQLDVQKRSAFFEVVRGIVRGYEAVSPLSQAEREAIGDMVIAIQLICVAAFAGSDRFAQLYEINRKMLQMMIDNEDKLKG